MNNLSSVAGTNIVEGKEVIPTSFPYIYTWQGPAMAWRRVLSKDRLETAKRTTTSQIMGIGRQLSEDLQNAHLDSSALQNKAWF